MGRSVFDGRLGGRWWAPALAVYRDSEREDGLAARVEWGDGRGVLVAADGETVGMLVAVRAWHLSAEGWMRLAEAAIEAALRAVEIEEAALRDAAEAKDRRRQ